MVVKCRAGGVIGVLAMLLVMSGPARAESGPPSTSFTVAGAVAHPLTETLTELKALAPVTRTVTYLSGGKSVTDTYTGVTLWDVLKAAGPVVDPAIKNDILRKMVIAAGSDGYRVAFGLGELDPKFGNAPVLVAYDDTGGAIAGGAGFARLVAPEDVAGGRYVSNLVSLTVVDSTP